MRRTTLLLLLNVITQLLISLDISILKDYYPKNVNLYFFNTSLDEVKRFAGDYEIHYTLNKTESGLSMKTSLNTKYEIELDSKKLFCRLYDSDGLWQIFSINVDEKKMKKFNKAYRFYVEGDEEPIMIDETRYYTYDEKGRLLNHKQPTEYSERTFHYKGDKTDYIENIIGNGETSFTAKDKFYYINETDYDVKPSHELIFHSIHYPVMDKKEHRVTYEGDVEIIRDTYYHNGIVYFEYIEKWEGDRILSFENYISVRKQTVK